MGHAALNETLIPGDEQSPLAVHHHLQLTLSDGEFLVSFGMKVLPTSPSLHAAGFNEHIALKLSRTFVDVRENEGFAVERVANPGACGRKEFHDFLPIAVASPTKARAQHVSELRFFNCRPCLFGRELARAGLN